MHGADVNPLHCINRICDGNDNGGGGDVDDDDDDDDDTCDNDISQQ